MVGYSIDSPPPVKIGACHALSQLLPKANKDIIQPQMMGLFSSLTDLLQVICGYVVSVMPFLKFYLVLIWLFLSRHLMKHCICYLKQCNLQLRLVSLGILSSTWNFASVCSFNSSLLGTDAHQLFVLIEGYLTAPMEQIITPIILNLWVSHVSDPFVSIDAVEVLEVISGVIVIL